jgi:hypothetical protein
MGAETAFHDHRSTGTAAPQDRIHGAQVGLDGWPHDDWRLGNSNTAANVTP